MVNLTLIETGQTFSFLAGQGIDIPVPAGLKEIHFDTTYTLAGQHAPDFNNDLGITINPFVELTLLSIAAGPLNGSVFQESTPNFTPPIPVYDFNFKLGGFNEVDGPEMAFLLTPEPGTFILIGAGLVGVGAWRHRANRRRACKA
jgi:hypothetical protein